MSVIAMETDVSSLSPVGCGAVIQRAFYPESVDELKRIAKCLSVEEYVILGGVTNTLILSDWKGCAVFTDQLKGISVRGTQVKVRSGERLSHLCGVAQYMSLGGLENLCGLPGTVGGALSGNAGCFGSEISDHLDSVTIFQMDTGLTEELTKEEIAFSYRYCNLRKNKDLILDATFSLYPEAPIRIAERMRETKRKRAISQPKGRSLGSFFKQYNGVSAGYYIERAGMKGVEENGIMISPEHANFFLNVSGDAEGYLALTEKARKRVQETFGMRLEREVIVVGEERSGDSDGRDLRH